MEQKEISKEWNNKGWEGSTRVINIVLKLFLVINNNDTHQVLIKIVRIRLGNRREGKREGKGKRNTQIRKSFFNENESTLKSFLTIIYDGTKWTVNLSI